jgi:hypothetical protein
MQTDLDKVLLHMSQIKNIRDISTRLGYPNSDAFCAGFCEALILLNKIAKEVKKDENEQNH